MSLVGMTFRYRALPNVRVQITKVEHLDSHSVFHYVHLDKTRREAKCDQDRFNSHFTGVDA